MSIFGILAIGLGAIANVPQLYRILKNKNAENVSWETHAILLIMYLIFLMQEKNIYLRITFIMIIIILLAILCSIYYYRNFGEKNVSVQYM